MIDLLYAASLGILFAIGVFQLLRRDLIKSVIGFGLLFTGINLFFLAAGAFRGDVPPYVDMAEKGTQADPLVQALILTAIVVSFGSYALLLAMVNIASQRYGTVDSDEITNLTK